MRMWKPSSITVSAVLSSNSVPKTRLEKIAGKTIYQLKEDFRAIRDQELAKAMRNKVS